MPNSVKEVEYCAFENCKNLSQVDLGSLERISFATFKNCTSLTSITIPKTLTNGPSAFSTGAVFEGSGLSKITFENGLTKIPEGILANTTKITSVTIPNSVTEIGISAFENSKITEIYIPNSVDTIEYDAFSDCSDLVKITILDSVEHMGLFHTSTTNTPEESVFNNHNEDLTIYCYEDSLAAKYAITYDIKYVYIPRPAGDESDDNDNNNNGSYTPGHDDDKGEDPTVAPGEIPYAGLNKFVIIPILIISTLGIFFFLRYHKLKDVK